MGFIFDKQRNPLPEVEMELLNDLGQTIRRTRTDNTGKYEFGGLSNGRYQVKAMPFRYDLEDMTQDQEINTQNIRGGEGAGNFSLDFILQPRKGGLADAELSVVFAQDVPDEAKKFYKTAVEHFAKGRQPEGISALADAIKVFPNYFQALYRMGSELFFQKRFKDAIPFLFKASDLNPKSATSFYYLGYSLHSLGKQYNKSALLVLTEAATLAPSSFQVLFTLGKIEREEGKAADAEKHLLQAKKSTKTPIPSLHFELAQTFADLKKYKDAADELETFIKVGKLKPEEETKIRTTIATLREKAKAQGT
ncbi:MAG: tetratricopeptide repeat protein [Acidobacteria bacterium]|nr:tetratricopeptide repeat protein [Acidobacteriota bacterium]MBK8809885.1 tetratricopeptide repeat protein [Acidobacteriota bacterium]